MENKKPQAQPQPQAQSEEMYGMTKKEALDTLLKNVAEGKKQIARGEYYTLGEARYILWRRYENKNNT